MSSMHFDDWPTTTDFDALMEPCLNTPVEMTCLPREGNDAFLQALWEPRTTTPIHFNHRNTSSRKRKSEGKMGTSCDEKLKALEKQLRNLDPTSKEAKKQRRLIRNRMSAQLHRERKKAYVDQLEGELRAREDEIGRLQAELASYRAMSSTSSTTSSSPPTSLPAMMKSDDQLFVKNEDNSLFEPFSDGFLDPSLWLEPSNETPSMSLKVSRLLTVVLSMAFFSNNFSWLESVLRDEPVNWDALHLRSVQCSEPTEWYGTADEVLVYASPEPPMKQENTVEEWSPETVEEVLQDPLIREEVRQHARLLSTLSTIPTSSRILQLGWPQGTERIVTFQSHLPPCFK